MFCTNDKCILARDGYYTEFRRVKQPRMLTV